MKNITITLPDDVAQAARVWAAREGTSVSRYLGDKLARFLAEDEAYEVAGRRFLRRKPACLREEGKRLPRREELHER
jgi:hypothetical protein